MTYPPSSTPLSSTVAVTSSIVPSIPTPTLMTSGGTFTIQALTHIPSINPKDAADLIRNSTSWPKWNSFCPKATITSTLSRSTGIVEVGTAMDVDVHMDGSGLVKEAARSRVVKLLVTVCEEISAAEGGIPGFRIAWKPVDMPYYVLRSERVFEFTSDGEGGTNGACWETFGGLLGLVVKLTVGGQLVLRFGDYMRDLRGQFSKDQLELDLLKKNPVMT